MDNPEQEARPTSSDSLRDFKNSILVMNTLFRKAILFIDMNLASPISTKDIAQNQYLTPNYNYLSARFKEEVGVCISDYLLKRRVDLACRLLTSSQLSVQEVAGKCGMGDASYFSRMFKRVMGGGAVEVQEAGGVVMGAAADG